MENVKSWNALRPYQKTGAENLSNNKSHLLADDMRLGKTRQAIVACNIVKANKILVVCPASAKIHWGREFEQLGRCTKYHIVYGVDAEIPDDAEIIIINYDLLRYVKIYAQLMQMFLGVMIFDEAHYLKGRESQRTKAVFGNPKKSLIGLASRSVYRWYLTGTPILNRPIEIYPLMAAECPQLLAPYHTYTAFAKRFCGGYWDGVQYFDKGATNRDDLRQRLKKFMTRRLKSEVFDQMPDKIFQIIPVDANKKLQKIAPQEFSFSKDDVERQDLETGDPIATQRLELGLEMVPHAIKHIKDLMKNGEKLIVYTYHRDVLKLLRQQLEEFNPVVLYGSTNSRARQAAIDSFQNDPETGIFIGQYKAAGEAICLSAADRMLFVEASWVPGEIDQPSDRAFDYMNPEKSILVQFMAFSGSLHEHMMRVVVDKKINIKEIQGDDHVPYLLT